MKIKELINKLKEYDENMEVVIYDWEDNTYDNAFKFSKEIESYSIGKDGKPIGSRIDKNIELALLNTSKWEKVVQKNILVIYADY